MDKNLFKDRIAKLHEGIWEVEDLPNGEYDNQAVKYDKLISNALYNRIMWGNSPKDYADFLRENLKNCGEGIIADIGCGTLSFTSEIYTDAAGGDAYRYPSHTACPVQFQIISDPAGEKGRLWLEDLLTAEG